MELTLNIRYMRQEAYRGLKFLHDLDIGYENLHKHFEGDAGRSGFYSASYFGYYGVPEFTACRALSVE